MAPSSTKPNVPPATCLDSLSGRQQRTDKTDKNERPIVLFRFLVLLSLFVAAVVCGAVSYIFLRESERSNFNDQYEAVAKQMENSISAFLEKYHATTDQLAVFANIKFPNSSDWPYVGIHDFHLLDQSIIDVTGSASANSILPIVANNDLAAFNAYARAFLDGEAFIAQYPQIYSLYGLGVWVFIDGAPQEITDGNSTADLGFKTRDLIVPVINAPVSVLRTSMTLGNLHALPETTVAMDDVLDCTDRGYSSCASLSGLLTDTPYGAVADTNIYRPVFSVDHGDGTRKVLGFTTVGFKWITELEQLIVDGSISGFHFVIRAIEQPSARVDRTFSYKLVDGKAYYLGPGDQHDRRYSGMKVSVQLSLIGSMAALSYDYVVSIYPTEEYENTFYTDTPLYTAVGFAVMIVFTSIIFFLYDYLVNENVKQKDQVLRMKRDFVRFISHEIRTPLNTVSVGLELLYEALIAQNAGVGEVTYQDMLELTTDVQTSTSTAVSVLNDLLNFDKLQAGELQLAEEEVFLWDTLATVVKSFKIPAVQKNISMDLVFDNSVNENVSNRQIMVLGDKFKICHIIRNMMSNALKFTNEGGTVVVKMLWSVEVEEGSLVNPKGGAPRVAPERSVATISVQDSGHGLTPEQISMLFRDGVQFNPNKLQAGQGSGLGLYLSQAIAELHGGKMWATSEGENKGATFYVRFPVDVSQFVFGKPFSNVSSSPKLSSEPSKPSELPRKDSGAVLFSSRESMTTALSHPKAEQKESTEPKSPNRLAPVCEGRVLVVDDAASNRKIVCRMLRQRGFECDEAKDGKECLAIVESKSSQSYYACILMDFEMPVMNGPDATVQLRQRGYVAPIFGLTGNVMVDDIEHFLRCGADHVLAKPFRVADFIKYLHEERAKIVVEAGLNL